MTGSLSGTWGDVLNAQVMGYLDLMLGGTTTVALSASNVTLTAAEARYAIVRFTGLLLANVIITTPCLGFTFFDNATTGNFTIEVQYTAGAGDSVFIEQGVITLVAIDATNGVRAEGQYPDLVAINALTGTGVLKRTGTNTWSLASGVTDLAATTANRLYGTDGSGNSSVITTGAGLAVAAGAVNTVPSTKSEMEAQSATAPVYPDVQKYHPMHPKAWVLYNCSTQTILASAGVSGVVRDSTGLFTVTLSTAFASATTYGALGWARDVSTDSAMVVSATSTGTKTTSTMQFVTRRINGTINDSTEVFVTFYGAQ